MKGELIVLCAVHGALDGVWHRCDQCPYILGLDNRVLKATEHLIPMAVAAHGDIQQECFGTGLLFLSPG